MEINNINYTYYDGTKVFENLSLNIKEKKITVIMGSTASGKSTLLKILAGETDNKLNLEFKRIGYMNEIPSTTFFNKTVKAEFEYHIDTNEYRIEEKSKRIKDVLKIVGLENKILNKNPMELTLREQRLVVLAKCLLINPELLVLDNPTIGLNDTDKHNIVLLLKMLKRKYHRTIIIATNDTDIGLLLADDIIIMKDGKIINQDSKYEVFKDYKNNKKNKIYEPNTIAFANKVLEKKNINMGYRDDINDLLKDIYRYSRW